MLKKENLIFLFCAFLFSWLWFTPAFWALAQGQVSFAQALYSIFFSTQEQEQLYGDTLDLQGTIWVFHHFDQIMLGNQDSILEEIYAPFGFDLGQHTGFGWGDALLSWPLIRLIPTPGFYNLHVFCTLVLSYFATMLLFRKAQAPILVAVALSFATCTHTFVRQELLGGRTTQTHWFSQ